LRFRNKNDLCISSEGKQIELNYFKPRETTISFTLLIRKSFQWYCSCESGNDILTWRVTWNCTYSPFKMCKWLFLRSKNKQLVLKKRLFKCSPSYRIVGRCVIRAMNEEDTSFLFWSMCRVLIISFWLCCINRKIWIFPNFRFEGYCWESVMELFISRLGSFRFSLWA